MHTCPRCPGYTLAQGLLCTQCPRSIQLTPTITNLEFLLTWDDDDDPKWYRWNSSLGENEKFNEHLDENKLRKFIPIKYTYPKDHPEEIARRPKRNYLLLGKMLLCAYYFCTWTKCLILWISDSFTFVYVILLILV